LTVEKGVPPEHIKTESRSLIIVLIESTGPQRPAQWTTKLT